MKDSPLLETILELLGVSEDNRRLFQLQFRDEQHRKRVEEMVQVQRRMRPYVLRRSVDDYLAKRKCKNSVADRIRRLNPGGVEEGARPHGVYWKKPRADFFCNDWVSPRWFINKHGVEKYRSLPRNAWSHRGCQKFMTRIRYMELGL